MGKGGLRATFFEAMENQDSLLWGMFLMMTDLIQKLEYRKAAAEDIDLLTKTRIEVLLAANGLPENTDMSEVEKQSRAYYENAIPGGAHTAFLVFDRDQFVGIKSAFAVFYGKSSAKSCFAPHDIIYDLGTQERFAVIVHFRKYHPLFIENP